MKPFSFSSRRPADKRGWVGDPHQRHPYYKHQTVQTEPAVFFLNSFSGVTDGLLADHTDVFGLTNSFTGLSTGADSKSAELFIMGGQAGLGFGNTFTDVGTGISETFVLNTSIADNTMTGVARGIFSNYNPKNALLTCEANKISATRLGILGKLNQKLNPLSRLTGNVITINGAAAGVSNGVGIKLQSGTHEGLLVNFNTIGVVAGSVGISGNGSKNISLFTNTISVANPALAAADCINLQNCSNLFARCNSLDRVTGAGGVGTGGTRGLFSASGSSNKFHCNTVNDLGFGMEFNDAALDFVVQGNTFGNLFHGLEMGELAWIGPQNEAGTDAGFGNTWAVNTASPVGGEFGAFHNSTNDIIVGYSLFKVNSSNNGCGNPAFNPTNNQQEWFKPNYTCALQCGGACPPPVVPGVSPNTPGTLRDLISSGTINNLPIPDGMKAKSRMQFYRLLDEQPALLSNSSYNSFKNVETGTSVGAFYAIEKAITNLPALSATDETTVATQSANLKNALNGIYQENQNQVPNATLRSQYFVQANSASSQIQTIGDALRNQTLLQLGFLKAQNAAISIAATWEINQKTVNNWTLSALAGEELAPTAAPSVLAIANQCPLEGGDAVYQARGIYGTYFDDLLAFDDHVLCAGVGQRQGMAQKAQEGNLLVYPNPTDDLLIVEGFGLESAPFFMINYLGQVVKQGILDGSAISTADLIPGLYWLTIELPNTRPQTEKFLISR